MLQRRSGQGAIERPVPCPRASTRRLVDIGQLARAHACRLVASAPGNRNAGDDSAGGSRRRAAGSVRLVAEVEIAVLEDTALPRLVAVRLLPLDFDHAAGTRPDEEVPVRRGVGVQPISAAASAEIVARDVPVAGLLQARVVPVIRNCARLELIVQPGDRVARGAAAVYRDVAIRETGRVAAVGPERSTVPIR